MEEDSGGGQEENEEGPPSFVNTPNRGNFKTY